VIYSGFKSAWFRRGMAAASLFGMILANGCLFQPRTPEDPDEDSVPWTLPIDPESVLENMRTAIDSQTSTNYQNSLGDGSSENLTFTFIASFNDEQEAENQGKPDYFEGFGRERELAALDKLYTQVDSLRIEWNFDPNTDMTVGSEETTIDLDNYQLYVSRTGSETTIYEGSALLTLRLDGGQWFLIIWDETESSTTQSWGRLRLNLDV